MRMRMMSDDADDVDADGADDNVGDNDGFCFSFATKIGCRRYKVYRKWQEHNRHP